ncbi:AMP-dependent synthetase/ligase [Glacieibacterium frigidum]|uniref:Long-chain fatty acid--CoA ligase n=1 Tax=Glacieibacterium frigidum TaxID=2593303 RepID=A0A552U8Y2_9SPHN|nr:AMP-dependent synthetase/ligase [Glacieibacterium frigidum]TRW14673.1 long-chain fatty acid--CoA ligase [Glacieibacterium frigidum]
MAESFASQIDRWPSLTAMFFDQARARGDGPFLWRKTAGAWQSISYADAARTIASLADALIALGIAPGDRVMLVSENRPEWCIADHAIMAAGAVTVPAYVTNTEADHLHILEDSGARLAIVSTAKLAATLLPAIYNAKGCTAVIGMEKLRAGPESDVALHDWATLIAAHPPQVEAVAARQTAQRGDLACLIYTSGTGGRPRGVRQHHGAIMRNIAGAAAVVDEDFVRDPSGELFLSFLPLSHAYEHTAGQFMPIGMGGQIAYAESLEKLAANIEEMRPTLMVVVPRLFEVLRTRIAKAIEKQGGIAVVLFNRALRLGRKRYEGTLAVWERPVDALLDRTVRAKIKARFGGRLKAMIAGGAPLNPEVGIFFEALGVTLLQGYGQTEAGPVISCNRPSAGIKMHSVGPPLGGVEVRIAEDGEILVRGELVMHGYWRNEAETAKALQGGWLHTGDIGKLDEDGHLVITDRKKDIIVNDKGDNVAPQRVEGMLTLQPEIAQAMVIGDKRPYLVGVVVADPEWAACWAKDQGLPVATAEKEPEFRKALMAAVDRVNARVSATEKVRRIIVADAPFTVENEQMTPSLKIRRHVLKAVYGERLDRLYAG